MIGSEVQPGRNMSADYFDLMRLMVDTSVDTRIDVEAALSHTLFDEIRDRFSTTADAWRIGEGTNPHKELLEHVESGRFNSKYDIYNSEIYSKKITKPIRFSHRDRQEGKKKNF